MVLSCGSGRIKKYVSYNGGDCDVSYINDGSGDDSMMVVPVMVIAMKMMMVHDCGYIDGDILMVIVMKMMMVHDCGYIDGTSNGGDDGDSNDVGNCDSNGDDNGC